MSPLRANERAAYEVAEYHALFEAAPDGILVVDEEGVVRELNTRALAMFGYDRGELLGEGVELLIPEESRRAHAEARRTYVTDPQTRPMGVGLELRGRRKDGTEFPVEISLSPLRVDGSLRVICIVRDETERRRLQAFGVSALRAAEEERQRIARELHDDTAQRLAALLLLLKLAGQAEETQERERRLERVREELAQVADGVRRIARGLRPPALDEAGLGTALDALVRSLRGTAGIDIRLSAERTVERLDSDAELAVYRIAQEALSNALRHSGASRVDVSFETDGRSVRIGVADDGCGFRVDRLEGHDGDSGRGLGLVGMRERARNAGGTLKIESTPGEGTRVSVELPIRRRSR